MTQASAHECAERQHFEGPIFVFFIALILRMSIVKFMQEKRLTSRYNLEGMRLELEKIKKIELSDGKVLTRAQ
jgi:hypothetical protein